MGNIILLHKPSIRLDSIIEPTITSTWVSFVKAGEEVAGIGLNEELESFLVFSLVRFTRRTDLFSRKLGAEYLRAATQLTGKRKEYLLQEVGDMSLLLAGLYPERHRRLNVSSSFFSDMGRLAYSGLADVFALKKMQGLEGLYRNVEHSFPVMTEVLHSAREKDIGRNSIGNLSKKKGPLSL